jgi:hypothetical protein
MGRPGTAARGPRDTFVRRALRLALALPPAEEQVGAVQLHDTGDQAVDADRHLAELAPGIAILKIRDRPHRGVSVRASITVAASEAPPPVACIWSPA